MLDSRMGAQMITPKETPTLLGKQIDVKGILRRLSDFVSLPSTGIVAGQAVASAIYEQIGIPVKPVYNDVDIFHVDKKVGYHYKIRDASVSTVSAWRNTVLQSDYGESFMSSYSKYSIVSTLRRGMLNHVYLESASHNARTVSVLDVVRTFDMNAVQVGIDLMDEVIEFTPAFAAFCKSLELEIVNLYTPAASLARFFIKKEQLAGAYGNEQWAVFNVGNALQMAENNQVHGVVTDFGEPTLKKLQSVLTRIDPYFEIFRSCCAIGRYQSYHLRVRPHFYSIECNVMPFKFTKDKFLGIYINERRRGLHHTTPNNIVDANRLFQRPKIFNRLKKLEETVQERAAELIFTRPQFFLRWDGNEKALKRVLKAFRHHPGLLHLASEENSISNQYRIITSLDQLADSRPYRETVYGTAEQMVDRCDEDDWIAKIDARCKRDYDEIASKKGEIVLGEKIVDGVSLRELNEGIMLLERGHEEHHCVASYVEKVEKGESVIIRLDTGKRSESATAELSRLKDSEDGSATYVIRQIRHSFNGVLDEKLLSRYTEALKSAFPHTIAEQKHPKPDQFIPEIDIDQDRDIPF